MSLGKARESLDTCLTNMNTYKFDIDKLMSTATWLTEGVQRQQTEITDLKKDLAVVQE